jgi:uncharacterized protein (DUF2336 family)
VRRALADVLAASPSAPPAVVLALASDQAQIAAPVLALSPLFVDADLVDAVATGNEDIQIAIASRSGLQRPVAAALAEVGKAEACLVLTQNCEAEIAEFLARPHSRTFRGKAGDSRGAARAQRSGTGDAHDHGDSRVRDAR